MMYLPYTYWYFGIGILLSINLYTLGGVFDCILNAKIAIVKTCNHTTDVDFYLKLHFCIEKIALI